MIRHALLLKKALTVNPIDAIFVVVEFSKPENIIELFETTTHPLERKKLFAQSYFNNIKIRLV